jgi:transcriptional regulator with XRE-family HTH domain
VVEGFGERLRYYMSLRGVTQSQLAVDTHLTEAAISRYLSNDREPKAIAVAAMARALNISADDLLGLTQASQGALDDALRLVARNANEITAEQKKQLINALVS